MARQPRIEYGGAFYHVTSRGNLGQPILFEDLDREKYIQILRTLKERYRYILHAYVLMENHYHLLIETPLANLNHLMHNLNTSYTVFINRKYQRKGHLFQGRYKAIIVDKDTYLLAVGRYIHLNPVRAHVVALPEDYQWSSYKDYIGYPNTGLVDTHDTLSYFSQNSATAMAEYKEFVESDIEGKERPFKDLKAGIVLGSDSFVKETIKEIIKDKRADRELPAVKRLFRNTSIEQVVKTVADHYRLYPRDLTKRSRKYSNERKIAIYLSKIMAGVRNSMVASHFGITPQAVTNILTEIEDKRVEAIEVREEIDKIKCIL